MHGHAGVGWVRFARLYSEPHDIRSSLTVALVSHDHFHVERFSLDWPYDATDDYFDRCLRDNPRRLHEMANQDPFVATRCFHLHRGLGNADADHLCAAG